MGEEKEQVSSNLEVGLEKTKNKAAVYLRVSTLEQAENGWSIEGQYKEIREFCDKEGYKVSRVYRDLGYSGSTIERPGLEKLLEHSCIGHFEKLLLWKYDRLSRDNMDFPALIHFLNKNDIEVISVKEPTPNDDSPYNEFVIGILGLISSLERKVFMMRSRMGMKVRLEKGYYKGSHPPFGYDYNLETGHLEINDNENKVVKEIYSKYLEIGTLHGVKVYCNKKKYPTKRRAKWRSNTIRAILTNRVYLGEYIYGDIKTHHNEIRVISDEQFEEVQDLLNKRSELGIEKRYYGDIDRDSLTYDYNGDDEKIQDFLQDKSEMPACPRCDNQISVSKWGWRDSPTVGKLQQYCCSDCNYEFEEFPFEEVKKDMPKCPKCHQQSKVRKEGHRKRKTKPPIQKYTCTECNYWFE